MQESAKPLTENTVYSFSRLSRSLCKPSKNFRRFCKTPLEIMAVFEETWQKTKSTIKGRGIFLFNNNLLSDVCLVVEAPSDESAAKRSKMAIPAHKFVLSICSPVFFAMFCGEMAEKSESIDLPDCEYEGVLEMLRYLYSEEVKLNESNVMQVLYVAKKYILPSLVDECIDFLQRNLDPSNVFCVLSHAKQYDESNLVDRCWEIIDRKTVEVVKSERFATIERNVLEAIVQRDQLTISEVELFKAVDVWATKECERQGLVADGSVKRTILGEQIVKYLRFPAMEEKEFASTVLDCNILTNKELRDLVKHFNGVLTTSLSFPEDRRVGTWKSCCRFDELVPFDVESGWSYDNSEEPDCIEFWVDKDLLLQGIRFFGSKDNRYCVAMHIKECQNDETLFDLDPEHYVSHPLAFKEKKIDVFDVLFDPIALRKSKHYAVTAFVEGPNSCYGTGGKYTVSCHGVTFYFKDNQTAKPIDATSVVCGQFAEFFFNPV